MRPRAPRPRGSYQSAMASVRAGREALQSLGLPFSRPTDFFAEMLKSDEHMGRVKARLIAERERMEAFSRRKRERETQTFAKQVHAAREQERAQERRQTLQKVSNWQKERRARGQNVLERLADDAAERDFDKTMSQRNHKRESKDRKYGFGGRKRNSKENDGKSSRDTSAFRPHRAPPGKKMGSRNGRGAERPGKRSRTSHGGGNKKRQ